MIKPGVHAIRHLQSDGLIGASNIETQEIKELASTQEVVKWCIKPLEIFICLCFLAFWVIEAVFLNYKAVHFQEGLKNHRNALDFTGRKKLRATKYWWTCLTGLVFPMHYCRQFLFGVSDHSRHRYTTLKHTHATLRSNIISPIRLKTWDSEWWLSGNRLLLLILDCALF